MIYMHLHPALPPLASAHHAAAPDDLPTLAVGGDPRGGLARNVAELCTRLRAGAVDEGTAKRAALTLEFLLSRSRADTFAAERAHTQARHYRLAAVMASAGLLGAIALHLWGL